MDVAFWISLCGVVYAYFGYPAVLVVAARLARARNDSRFPEDALPSISIVIPAHTEAAVIGAKLENTLALPYPGAAEIIVVSDGSSDGTEDIILSHSDDERLVYVGLSERKGKANALNQGVSRASGDVVVFSDALIILDEQALVEIVQPFADPAVGCVSGEDKIAGSDGEGLYGRYELFLRRMESRLGSIVGASGSFYAQRRELVRLQRLRNDAARHGLPPDHGGPRLARAPGRRPDRARVAPALRAPLPDARWRPWPRGLRGPQQFAGSRGHLHSRGREPESKLVARRRRPAWPAYPRKKQRSRRS